LVGGEVKVPKRLIFCDIDMLRFEAQNCEGWEGWRKVGLEKYENAGGRSSRKPSFLPLPR
jgi:hypothetical protein